MFDVLAGNPDARLACPDLSANKQLGFYRLLLSVAIMVHGDWVQECMLETSTYGGTNHLP